MSNAELQLLEDVRSARKDRKPLRSRGDRDVELTAAYRIQERLSDGVGLKGFKLGLLSPAKQQQMGIDHPTYGRISPTMLKEGVVSLDEFMQPRVEPEVAVLLAGAVAPGATPGQVRAAIGGFFLGMDILDTVWQDYRFTAAEVVADNTSGGGFVLGTKLLPAPPSGSLRLYQNGKLESEGPVSALGDPVERLAFLADEVGGLQEGQVVFLGSPAAAVPASPGLIEIMSEDDCLSVKVDGVKVEEQ